MVHICRGFTKSNQIIPLLWKLSYEGRHDSSLWKLIKSFTDGRRWQKSESLAHGGVMMVALLCYIGGVFLSGLCGIFCCVPNRPVVPPRLPCSMGDGVNGYVGFSQTFRN